MCLLPLLTAEAQATALALPTRFQGRYADIRQAIMWTAGCAPGRRGMQSGYWSRWSAGAVHGRVPGQNPGVGSLSLSGGARGGRQPNIGSPGGPPSGTAEGGDGTQDLPTDPSAMSAKGQGLLADSLVARDQGENALSTLYGLYQFRKHLTISTGVTVLTTCFSSAVKHL